MCNPPFYTSRTAMQRSAKLKARAPRSVLTAGDAELLATGGEVVFVGRMITESVQTRRRCRWYTSLVGHLSSLAPLVEQLHANKVDCMMVCYVV
jgi:23S rRNA A1618 N6-methylase RlmF